MPSSNKTSLGLSQFSEGDIFQWMVDYNADMQRIDQLIRQGGGGGGAIDITKAVAVRVSAEAIDSDLYSYAGRLGIGVNLGAIIATEVTPK